MGLGIRDNRVRYDQPVRDGLDRGGTQRGADDQQADGGLGLS